MKRYTIVTREYGSDKETDLAEVDTNPEPIVAALFAKNVAAMRKRRLPKYEHVWIRCNAQE